MRDFLINSFEKLVSVIIVLMGLGVIIGALAATFSSPGDGPDGVGGPFAGLFILIGGSIYLILVGGFMYLGLGSYQNTKRTAEALEKLLMKGSLAGADVSRERRHVQDRSALSSSSLPGTACVHVTSHAWNPGKAPSPIVAAARFSSITDARGMTPAAFLWAEFHPGSSYGNSEALMPFLPRG